MAKTLMFNRGSQEGRDFSPSQGAYLRRVVFGGVFYLVAVSPLFAMYRFGPTMLAAFGLSSGNSGYRSGSYSAGRQGIGKS